jgi:hypothetical protein
MSMQEIYISYDRGVSKIRVICQSIISRVPFASTVSGHVVMYQRDFLVQVLFVTSGAAAGTFYTDVVLAQVLDLETNKLYAPKSSVAAAAPFDAVMLEATDNPLSVVRPHHVVPLSASLADACGSCCCCSRWLLRHLGSLGLLSCCMLSTTFRVEQRAAWRCAFAACKEWQWRVEPCCMVIRHPDMSIAVLLSLGAPSKRQQLAALAGSGPVVVVGQRIYSWPATPTHLSNCSDVEWLYGMFTVVRCDDLSIHKAH